MKKKSQLKYEQILAETVNLINEKDVAMVSTNQVAKKVGISQSNIYIYFKNRDDLISQVFTTEVNKMSAFVIERIETRPTDNLKAKFELTFTVLFQYALKFPKSMTVIQKILQSYAYTHMQDQSAAYSKANGMLVASLDAGIATGLLKPIDRTLLQNIIFSTIKLHADNLHRGRYTERDVPFDQVAAMIWDAISA
ncbi:TetR/AcrR family transcriptional regulator [Levilactobacillus bambusae]|uniref:HTH tetR-type domain-containing protein n=1 Tax=Levilactobacillus bambusae TaxID=2024736 RepID=A0A2V1N218_9LACO|nr:TetR/AcrR family transcriptional regulator [Levilactobacillus bambusae]PWG00365.1 hypothetical protein DCM90_05395 [Levilactobacillus bambusae]